MGTPSCPGSLWNVAAIGNLRKPQPKRPQRFSGPITITLARDTQRALSNYASASDRIGIQDYQEESRV